MGRSTNVVCSWVSVYLTPSKQHFRLVITAKYRDMDSRTRGEASVPCGQWTRRSPPVRVVIESTSLFVRLAAPVGVVC